MKQLALITLLIIGFQINAMQMVNTNDNCTSQIVKSSSNKNGIVKKTNGEIVTNNPGLEILFLLPISLVKLLILDLLRSKIKITFKITANNSTRIHYSLRYKSYFPQLHSKKVLLR